MAVRDAVEVPLEARRSFRPPVALLSPVADAAAASVAVVLTGGATGAVLAGAVAVLALQVDRSRAARIAPRLGDDVGWIVARVAIAVTLCLPLFPRGAAPQRAALLGLLFSGLLVAGRAFSYTVVRVARARGAVRERTLIVGEGATAEALGRALLEHPELGLRCIGVVGSAPSSAPLALLGGVEDLADVVASHEVRRVIVAFGFAGDELLVAAIRACSELPVEIHVVPRLFELGAFAKDIADAVWGLPLVHIRRPAMRASARITKRGFDLVVASIILVAVSPVMALAALAVRVSSPGPVLFRQERVGQGGRPFRIMKFRTMRENDDSDTQWSVKDDDRLTGIGRFLRATDIDELPQLFNVVRGEMSLVGPRPERPYFVDQFTATVPRYRDRLRVNAGITGSAQVQGLRGDTSIPDRVRFDNAYIESWSLWGDLAILVKTVGRVFRARPR